MSHSIKFVKVLTPLAFAIALASCGGGDASFGGNSTSSGFGSDNSGKSDETGETTSNAASLDFAASSLQLMSSGKKSIILSAIVKDKNNNTIKDEEVIFSVDNGGTISVDEGIDGVVKTATLTPGSSKANRTLTVRASAGTLAPVEILIDVVGTRINIDGAESITINKQPEYILKLQDSDNLAIPNTEVKISSDFGTVTPQLATTDVNGEVKVTLTATTAGIANIKAESLNAVSSKKISISGNDFTLLGSDLNNDGSVDAKDYEVKLDQPERITLKWLVNGVAQVNKVIMIRATRGALLKENGSTPLIPSTITTNSKGEAVFSIKSSTAGSATIIAEAKDGGLTATISREFVATTPAYLSILASPTLISPTKSSAIIARVRDIHDNPVKNIALNFNLQDTVNGTLSSAKAITDSLGRAEISYTAGNSSSALNGVIIKSKLENTAYSIDEEEVRITVGGDAVRLTLGHDQLVSPDEIFYIKRFGVIVTDSAGNPIKDKKISFTITPKKYYKGFLSYNDTDQVWEKNVVAACDSEDVNKNGKMDRGEDVNHNNRLEPTHDATVTSSGTTDEKGKVVVEVIYPKNTALWTEQQIESTTVVNGTEYKEYTNFILPVLAADVASLTTVPPNILSPYGTWGTCTDNPDGEAPTPTTAPPKIEVLSSQDFDVPVTEIKNSTFSSLWYAVKINGKRAEKDVDYTIEINDGADISVEYGPYDDFKIIDNNPDKDESGYFISITSKATVDRPLSITQPFFFRDSPVGGSQTILTLNGLANIYINQGGVYNELGANAIDQEGNILEVKTFGNVDTSKPGVYTIIYRVTDQFGTSSSITRTVIVKDNDVPVVSLHGNSTVTLNIGENYIELGASATDLSDGDISSDIKIEDNVDTTVAGTYYVSYSVKDSSDNVGVSTRTVIVQ